MEKDSFLTLDIGGTAIKAVLFGGDGRILKQEEQPSFGREGGPALMAAVIRLIEGHSGYRGVGVSCTGQIDAEQGRVIYGNENVPNFTGTQIRRILEERFEVPVSVDNDVNAAALGEAYFGAGVGEPDFLCLTYGTGVGGAIVQNGAIYGGQRGVAAEFGHILTHPGGRSCACGGRGCYEQYASATALVHSAARAFPHIETGRQFFSELEGNPQLDAILSDWILEISYGLVTLTHVFNPSLFVLGGGVLGQSAVLPRLEKAFHGQVMKSYEPVRIRTAKLGNLAGAYGALFRIRRLAGAPDGAPEHQAFVL